MSHLKNPNPKLVTRNSQIRTQNSELRTPLAVVGCDFRVAGRSLREQLITTREERQELGRRIRSLDSTAGFAALETCNRVEWIVSGNNPTWLADILKAQFIEGWLNSGNGVSGIPEPYIYTCDDAVNHLLRVVSGLESLAAGEAQIAGQFHRAMNRAQEEGTSSIVLNGLRSSCGRMAKAATRVGYRSNHRVGIHGLAAQFIDGKIDGLNGRSVIVAGMGEIGRKTAALLGEHYPGCKVTCVNRTVSSSSWKAPVELPDLLTNCHAMIVATGSRTPVFTGELLRYVQAETMEKSHDNPGRKTAIPIMDIGVPRQIATEVSDSGFFDYFGIDDLVQSLGKDAENPASLKLLLELKQELNRFRRFCLARDVVHLLDTVHQKRRYYVQNCIPSIMDDRLPELQGSNREQVEAVMKQIIGDYANDIFQSIHTALEDYRSAE